MRSIYIYAVAVIIAGILFAGIFHRQDDNDLICTTSDFNIPISCIAFSQENDSILWAGQVNGNIVRINFRMSDKIIIPTRFNSRIYDIVQETDTTLWLGVRNHGLVKVLLKNNAIAAYTSYKIAVPSYEPSTNYAPYDIEMDKDGTLYIGTSSGVYRLNKNERNNAFEPDTLTTVYRPHSHKVYHFGVHQVKIWNDSVVCATDRGLVILAKNKEYQNKKPLIDENFSHLYIANDSVLYATSDSVRYQISKDRKFRSTNIPAKNLFAYIVDASEYTGKWEFTATQINYSDKNGKLSPFVLPERMSKNYNYLCLGKDFLFFALEKTLYSLALHQNTKGKSNHIIAAHTVNNDICYFISNNNCLYFLPKYGKAVSADAIGDFERGENIIQMCSSGKNRLWFITDKRHLYTINLKPSLFKRLNPFQKTYKVSLDPLSCDFKCLFYDHDNDNLYVGSRYRLYRIHDPENKSGKRYTYTMDIKPENDLYVTDICRGKEDDNEDKKLFISSLNHGLLEIGKDSLIKRKSRKEVGSIHKMATTSNKLLLLSSEGIFYSNKSEKDRFPTNEQAKSISTLYNFNGEEYYIGYHGIGTMICSDTVIKLNDLSHLDISFNRPAITAGMDTGKENILLGSRTGLYKYNGKSIESVDILQNSISPKTAVKIALFILLFLLAVSTPVWRNIRKNITKQIENMSTTVKNNEHEILNKVRLENQQDLHDNNNRIKINLLNIQKNQDRIFKLRNNIAALKKSEEDLNLLRLSIQSKYITRHEIINENKELISRLKDAVQKIEEHEMPDSISSSYMILKKLVKQAYDCIIQLQNLVNENNRKIATLKQTVDSQNQENQEKENKITELIHSITETLEACNDNEIKKALKSPKNKDDSSFDELMNLIDLLHFQFKNFAELLGKKIIDFTEINLTAEIQKDICEIENLTVNMKNAANVKNVCDKFIEKYSKNFTGYDIFKYMRPDNKKDKDKDKVYMLILHYQKNISPSSIGSILSKITAEEVGKFKSNLVYSQFPQLFQKHPKAKDDPLIVLLYKRALENIRKK
ncbi:MAG: hypothetical protein LBF59_00835 [Prevotellaceae bacterium]|jgi:hypothetical protein|nr:hypothetical protein [Prevotellaceae bacterium]